MTATAGAYTYRLNGEIAPVRESWLRRGSHWESTREAPGLRLHVRAELGAEQVQACELTLEREALGVVAATYELGADTLRCRRRDALGELSELALPCTGLILYPLMRIFTGPVISALDHCGGKGRVVVPNVHPQAGESQLLLPDSGERSVNRLPDEDRDSAACWQFIGGRYRADARFWVADDGLLQRYTWCEGEQQQWDVQLLRDVVND